jgi:putative NADH-flavin reductase
VNLLLLGSTGRAGRVLLEQALDRGHDVAVLVRSPEKLPADPRLGAVRVGSVLDEDAVDSALEGRDAVLSTLGSRRPSEAFGTTFMTDAMRALVPAMTRRGVRRLVVLSAAGVGAKARHAPFPIRAAFATALRQIAKDKARSEAYVRESGLDWTFVYPPMLTDGPITKSCRAGEDLRLKGMARISKADVAHFMLDQLESAAFSCKDVVVGP